MSYRSRDPEYFERVRAANGERLLAEISAEITLQLRGRPDVQGLDSEKSCLATWRSHMIEDERLV